MTSIKIIFLVVCAFLAYVYLGGITWVPFVLVATFIFIANSRPKKTGNPNRNADTTMKPVPIGVLGYYDVDDDGDLSYGLFILLDDKNIFIDIREDGLIVRREELARSFLKNCHTLEKNLIEFRSKNILFKNDSIYSFGIHSADLSITEVFWDSGKYTTMRNFQFIDDA